jgi:quinol monooxygenase YgiN
MTDQCTVIAIFTPKLEHREEVRELLLRITPLVHSEPGCVFYTMNEDVDGRFIHIEAWATRALWQEHNNRQTVKDIVAGVAGKLERDVEVYEMYNQPTGTAGKGSLTGQ